MNGESNFISSTFFLLISEIRCHQSTENMPILLFKVLCILERGEVLGKFTA